MRIATSLAHGRVLLLQLSKLVILEASCARYWSARIENGQRMALIRLRVWITLVVVHSTIFHWAL